MMGIPNLNKTHKKTLLFSVILFSVAMWAVVVTIRKTIGGLSLVVIAGVVGYLTAVVLIARVPRLSQEIKVKDNLVDYERRTNLSILKMHIKMGCVLSFVILAWLLNTYIPTGSMFEKKFTIIKKIDARPKRGWELVLRYDNGSTKFLTVTKIFWDSVSVKENIKLDLQSGALGFDVIHNYRKIN